MELEDASELLEKVYEMMFCQEGLGRDMEKAEVGCGCEEKVKGGSGCMWVAILIIVAFYGVVLHFAAVLSVH
jgi:hypothetical protein